MSLHDTYGIKKVDISTSSKPLEEIFLSIINPGKEFVGDYTTDGYGHVGAVLEEIVEQDSEFGKMSPKSLNVIRIGTLRAKGKIHLLGAYTKISKQVSLKPKAIMKVEILLMSILYHISR